MNETTFELRTLEAKDIAPCASILSKIGISELKQCFSPEEMQGMIDGKNVEAAGIAVGLNIAGVVLSNYEKAQTDIFKFLASLSGMDIKDVEKLPLDTFTEMIIAVVQKEEFKSFFSVVSKLFK